MKRLYPLLYRDFTLDLLIKITGNICAIYVFALFTRLLDSEIYLNVYSSMGGAPCRTKIVHAIASSLNYISNPLFTHLIFSLFSGIGILIVSYILKNKFILLLLIAPSALIWTSVVGKEAIFYGANSLLLAFWTIYIKDSHKNKLNIFSCLGVLSLLVLCIIFRPHYSLPLLYLFASSFILITCKHKIFRASLIYLMLIMASLIIFYFYVVADAQYNLILHGYENISPSGFSSRHAFFNIDLTKPFLVFDKSLVFKYSFFSIVGPMPNELVRIEFVPFFFEGLMILLFPVFTFFYFQRKKLNDKYFLLFKLSLLPAIIMAFIIHAPFGILNPGSGIRWRVNFELLFYAYPLILILLSRNGKNERK